MDLIALAQGIPTRMLLDAHWWHQIILKRLSV